MQCIIIMHCIKGELMQQVIAKIGGRFERLNLPSANSTVWPVLLWGRFDQPLTPAFWTSQAWMAAPVRSEDYRLGRSLTEEVVFCLLGAHGAPAEVGLAAASRVCETIRNSNTSTLSCGELEELLLTPLQIGERVIRYRFAKQRARYLAGAFEQLTETDFCQLNDISLRQALCALPGIGPKTASWIVRNHRGSDRVAILDVHIMRACSAIDVFPENLEPARHYTELEQRFLAFCEATGSRASAMDSIMWSTMRSLSRSLLQQLVDRVRNFTHADMVDQQLEQPCPEVIAQEMMGPGT